MQDGYDHGSDPKLNEIERRKISLFYLGDNEIIDLYWANVMRDPEIQKKLREID